MTLSTDLIFSTTSKLFLKLGFWCGLLEKDLETRCRTTKYAGSNTYGEGEGQRAKIESTLLK